MSISRAGNNGNSQACAACKYQRKKCAPDCILAPYFPHDRQPQFLNAHKLFGVRNITKIIENLSPPQKDEAMRTIIIQSDVRASDPVGGCYRIIKELQRQLEFHKAELDLVLHQLAICRAQAQQQPQMQQLQDASRSTFSCDANSSDPLSSVYNTGQAGFRYLQNHHEQFLDQGDHNTAINHQLHDADAWVSPQESLAHQESLPSSSLTIEQQRYGNGFEDDVKPVLDKMRCLQEEIRG